MEVVASSKDSSSSISSSPFSSPNVRALLNIKVISWSQETGLPVLVRVRVGDRVFKLHKYPLLTKSGYFKKRLTESNNEIELPQDFPGGPETFEMIALFMYGSSTLVDPFNVAALRCAAEFLELKEEHYPGNLCERFDLYLNRVVLQNWDDTLIVLGKCRVLQPWSEDLLLVTHCIESLAFMSCMEILDPERRREEPVITLDALTGQNWRSETVIRRDLWIKDLIALPFEFFERIIGSVRRQGMKEKYVTPIIVFYANKWVGSGTTDGNVLRGIVDLLPLREKAGKLIPVGFYFGLLSRSFEVGLESRGREMLRDQIASLLHLARFEDFLFRRGDDEAFPTSEKLVTMESIFSTYISSSSNKGSGVTCSASNSTVAELWDRYLLRVASDHPNMESKRFMHLVETVPISFRRSHDQLYRALDTFLQIHKDLTQDERSSVCKYLNCQNMSQDTCIDAVQNELMPLRLIVQALFVQQLNTHKTFKQCSDSFRYTHRHVDFSGTLSSTTCPNSKTSQTVETPYSGDGDRGVEPCSKPLSLLLEKVEFSRTDYESTSFRIKNLEHELVSLKKSLKWQSLEHGMESVKTYSMKPIGSEGRLLSKARNPIGQVTSCIGSLGLGSQRKYTNRLMKLFRRLSFFGSRKSKRTNGDF